MVGEIIRYNTHEEDHTSEPYNFYIGRLKGKDNPLANPFTYNGVKTSLAKLSFKTREEAVDAYRAYFKRMYGVDDELTNAFDEIYDAYKQGNKIYLQCFCSPNCVCHGDVLIEEMQKKLIKEKIAERRTKRKTEQIIQELSKD